MEALPGLLGRPNTLLLAQNFNPARGRLETRKPETGSTLARKRFTSGSSTAEWETGAYPRKSLGQPSTPLSVVIDPEHLCIHEAFTSNGRGERAVRSSISYSTSLHWSCFAICIHSASIDHAAVVLSGTSSIDTTTEVLALTPIDTLDDSGDGRFHAGLTLLLDRRNDLDRRCYSPGLRRRYVIGRQQAKVDTSYLAGRLHYPRFIYPLFISA